MNITSWIDLNLADIKHSLLYGKYFDSIGLEKLGDEFSLFNPELGIDLILREDQSIKAMHFFSGKQEGVKRYVGEIPFTLYFSYSRKLVREVLGLPETSGGGEYSVLYGETPFWDRYRYDNFMLHLQFGQNLDSIDLITVYSSKEMIG